MQTSKPLKQLQDLTTEDLKKCSCPCCGLPSPIIGKLEPYKTCDNPDEFSNCGQGVIIYYSFIKFVIFISLIATIVISFLNSFVAYYYTNELSKFCDKYKYEYYNNFSLYEFYTDLYFIYYSKLRENLCVRKSLHD